MNMSHSRIIHRLGIAALATLAGYSLYLEPRWLQLEHIVLPVQHLPPPLAGFRIIHMSDLHLESFTPPALVRQAVQVANSRQADLVVLTGDFATYRASAAAQYIPMLAPLTARHGVFAIYGNHDLWTDAATVQQALQAAGIPLLCNCGVTLGSGEGRLYLAGLDDYRWGKPDLPQALAALPDGVPCILLAHEPDIADTAARDGRIHLQLSGHTHGGQVRLPLVGPPMLPRLGKCYIRGLYRVRDEMWLYVTRGIGTSGLPVRYDCRPEITEITLVSSAAPAIGGHSSA